MLDLLPVRLGVLDSLPLAVGERVGDSVRLRLEEEEWDVLSLPLREPDAEPVMLPVRVGELDSLPLALEERAGDPVRLALIEGEPEMLPLGEDVADPVRLPVREGEFDPLSLALALALEEGVAD